MSFLRRLIRPSSQRLRIVVLGYLVRGRYGGMAWHYLHYLKGLEALGHDVYFCEDSTDQALCHQPEQDIQTTDAEPGLRFAADALDTIGFGERWAYYNAHEEAWAGPLAEKMVDVCKSADLLINISGWINPIRPWLAEIPVRALIDTDPGFTQIRHLTAPGFMEEARKHTVFFSFGENIGSPIKGSPIRGKSISNVPGDGLPWQATRQPVTLDDWPVTPPPPDGRITTVLSWNSFGAMEYDGLHYGMKDESLKALGDLPRKTESRMELEVCMIPDHEREWLAEQGWIVRGGHDQVPTPRGYQEFIRESRAEIAIAKHGYVVSQCGWFSERTAVYLASGRPALVQQTGFSEWLAAEGGVIPFVTAEDALQGLEELNAHYGSHQRAAREIAEEYFEAGRVLRRLVEKAMTS